MRLVPVSFSDYTEKKLKVMALKRDKAKIPVWVDILSDNENQNRPGIPIRMELTARQCLDGSAIFERRYASAKFIFEPEDVVRIVETDCKELPGKFKIDGAAIPVVLFLDGVDISIRFQGDLNNVRLKFPNKEKMNLLQRPGENYMGTLVFTP